MDLLLSMDGRIGRKPFWIGMIVLLLISVALGLLLGPLLQGAGRFLGFLIGLVFLYPAIALMLKRLRDRERANPLLWVALYILPGQIVSLFQAFGIGFSPVTLGDSVTMAPTLLGMIASFAAIIAFLCALIDLGFLAGKSTPRTVRA